MSMNGELQSENKIFHEENLANNKESSSDAELTLYKKIYLIIKDNTAQIAIAIPVIAAIYTAVSNYYFYIVNCGYYKYFGIDDKFMLPYSKISLYQNITFLALLGLYWAYSLFAVRMFVLKKNIVWKIVLFLMVPFLINIFIAFEGSINLGLIIAGIILIPLHWIMIFCLGYCMEMPSENIEVLNITGNRKKWGKKEYRTFGLVIIFTLVVAFFYNGHSENYRKARDQRDFGIVEIGDQKYAVIDANENQMILQKCSYDATTLIIFEDTYLCADNGLNITFKEFESVEVTR